MPIYEYQCNDCGFRCEKIRKISDPALTQCPECHKHALKKLISATSFRLKGGGWYETDFKTSGKKKVGAGNDNKEPKTGSADASSAGKGGSTPDSKADTQAEKSKPDSANKETSSTNSAGE